MGSRIARWFAAAWVVLSASAWPDGGCDKNHFILSDCLGPVGLDMAMDRFGHTASLLRDGRVLVTGGLSQDWITPGSASPFSVEIYDPASNTWRFAAPLGRPRYLHRAVVLLDGRVFVVGGEMAAQPDRVPVGSAEIYDPASDQWTVSAPMIATHARAGHTATLLPDGRVLVVGGWDRGGGTYGWSGDESLSDAELYDPSSDSWTVANVAIPARIGHSATLLRDGRVLLAGGSEWRGPPSNAVEVFDPKTGVGAPVAPMLEERWGVSAAMLPDGRVLVAGGMVNGLVSGTAISTTRSEIFDPSTGTWAAGPQLRMPRGGHTVVALPDGSILAIGGEGDFYSGVVRSDVVDRLKAVSTGWEPGPRLPYSGRVAHTATVLPDGSVLVAGGYAFIDFGDDQDFVLVRGASRLWPD